MGFYANRTKAGTKLVLDGAGGTLKVLSGKARPSTTKASKDDGNIKKGDEISGIEFILLLADSENIKGQIYQQPQGGDKYGKYIPDPQPLVFPLVASFFLPGKIGEAYIKFFANAEKLGLPSDIADGFSGSLSISDTKYTDLILADDYSKPEGTLGMFLDDAQKVECKLDFLVPSTNNGGGSKSQSESERILDRIAFVKKLLTSGSDEELLLTELVKLDETMNHTQFIKMILG